MKKHVIARILNLIGVLLMLTVILVMIPLTIPKLFGYQIYGVLTGSMTPAYSVGGVVYVQTCEPQDVKVGDTITFRMGTDTDYVMTHRVVEIDKEVGAFTTKGDANETTDAEPVNFERLIGKVVFYIPMIASVSDFVNSTTGKSVLFIAFAIAFILWMIADMLAPKKSKKTMDSMKKHRFSGRTAVIMLGSAMIVAAVFYLANIFFSYKASRTEYDNLAKQIFAQDTQTDPLADEAQRKAMNEQIISAVADLQKTYPEVIGWIKFDNVDINYPIMQTVDNDYYLTHTFSGEKNSSGSIFMEAANQSDFSDTHTIIYGHNMKDLSMFGILKKYKTEDFYRGNEYFTIYTEKEAYRYQIFAYYDIDQSDEIYTIGFAPDEMFQSFIDKMRKRSYYNTGVEAGKDDKIITLSTCSTKGKRFVINAKRIEN